MYYSAHRFVPLVKMPAVEEDYKPVQLKLGIDMFYMDNVYEAIEIMLAWEGEGNCKVSFETNEIFESNDAVLNALYIYPLKITFYPTRVILYIKETPTTADIQALPEAA